jgi:hypothetical protein
MFKNFIHTGALFFWFIIELIIEHKTSNILFKYLTTRPNLVTYMKTKGSLKNKIYIIGELI